MYSKRQFQPLNPTSLLDKTEWKLRHRDWKIAFLRSYQKTVTKKIISSLNQSLTYWAVKHRWEYLQLRGVEISTSSCHYYCLVIASEVLSCFKCQPTHTDFSYCWSSKLLITFCREYQVPNGLKGDNCEMLLQSNQVHNVHAVFLLQLPK